MKKLVILYGIPHCGKEKFVTENNLQNYTVSEDAIRFAVASTAINTNGDIEVSRRDDKWIADVINNILERRFQHGLFTVYNPTSVTPSDITTMRQLANKYGYKIYCVDFSHVPFSEIKEENDKFENEMKIEIHTLERLYDKMMYSQIFQGVEILKPSEPEKIFYQKQDYSKWDKIHFIGDIHGSYDVLMRLIGELNEKELYVFCGDYLDRGTQNVETLEYLLSIMDKENVILLSGNHEKHLKSWANKETIMSQQFYNVTKKELEAACVSTKKVKRFCDNLQECFFGLYYGKTIIACHGGISNITSKIDFLSTEQFVSGVGKYKDGISVEKSFHRNMPDMIMIHGHRNVAEQSINPVTNCYNLENAVEAGGTIRMVTISEFGCETKEIVNTNFANKNVHSTIEEVKRIKNDPKKQNLDNILIDDKCEKIVLRNYGNDELITQNTNSNLKDIVPISSTVYKGINGDIVAISSHNGSLVFDCNKKSQNELKSIFTTNILYYINIFCNQNDATVLFIWNEQTAELMLLDIIYNSMTLQKMHFDKQFELAKKLGVKTRRKVCTIYSMKDLKKMARTIALDSSYIIEKPKGKMLRLISES